MRLIQLLRYYSLTGTWSSTCSWHLTPPILGANHQHQDCVKRCAFYCWSDLFISTMLFHPNYLYLLMTVTVFVKCEFIQTENPCKKTTCETISTQLITKHQYLNSVSKSHHSQPNKLLHSKSGQDSWINILRRRKRRRLKHRHRLKRSPTRTIVSVNSDYQRRRRSNSKCHKYARFQVSDWTLMGHSIFRKAS